MASLRDIVQFPRDAYTLLKMVMKARKTLKQIPAGPHWAFCYDMQYKLFRGFTLLNQQLDTDRLRDVLCVYHLIIRAIDTIEDDTSISNEVKLPILKEFHRHIYDPEWHFSCGSKKLHKVLMDGFHHVRAAFLELESSYQQAIVDHTIRMGAGMAKFLCKEVETIDDYDEYCDTITGSGVIAMSKMFHASGTEDLAPDALAISFGVFVQKMDVIMDYLEDINEKPTPRKFWPREIWSKYANKLEDFKYEENSVKAVQCLNEMVTNALAHLEESMKYVFTFQDSTLFRLFGTALIVAVGTLALCYNNIQVFRRAVKVRGGLAVKIVTRTKTRSDVYGAVHDFSRMLKSKACLGMSETHSQLEMLRGNVADNDPNAGKTKDILDAILKTCRDSGNLDDQRESYIIQSMPQYSATLIAIIFAMSAILLAYLVFASRPTNTCKTGYALT